MSTWANPDEPKDPVGEIAAVFAAGYLRLLLRRAPDATSPDVSAGCGVGKSGPESDIGLDGAERKSVHGGDATNHEKPPRAGRARPR